MKDWMKQVLFAGIALASVFYAGFVVGGRDSVVLPPPNLEITRGELIDALGPTPEQRARLEEIIEGTEREASDVMEEVLTRIRELTDDTERRMRDVLLPEQVAILDSILAQQPEPRMRRRR